MAVVIEMRPELYDRFWKRCELMGREYAILRNGLIVRRPKGEHYERIIEISCEVADAKNLLAIAANICLKQDVVRDRVIAALDGANLLTFVEGLPQGIDSLIGHNGSQLSGGQRQRLAIARAIYKDAPILLLDEATSALDSESERLVQSALEKLMAGRTSIVIAHRLSTVEAADRVIVLDQGCVVEQGTHAELIARGGLFSRLHALQFNA